MAAKMRTDKPVSSIRGRPASSAFRAAGYIPRYRRERAGIYDPSSPAWPDRSEEHTSELQSLMRISYAVFCLKKKKVPHLPACKHRHLDAGDHYANQAGATS